MNQAPFFTLIIWTLAMLLPVSNANSQPVDIDAQIAEFKLRQQPQISPSDVSFTIRFVNDQKQFRQGEIIRLEMLFASSSPETYRLDTATYDRRGRLDMDTFHIEPNTGFTDPMRDHLGIWGGGLRGSAILKEEPELIVYELNEWFRFDQPGKYRLSLTSPRVSHKDHPHSYFGGDIVLTSNLVEFEIVKPEAGWAEQELQKILKALNGSSDRRAACRALRFLGTKEAVPELVRRYGQEDAFEFYAGLVSSPHRDLVIETMAARLAAPDQAVSSSWFYMLVRLSSPSWWTPESYDEQQAKVYRERYNEISSQAKAKYAKQLAKTVALKTGKARAISLLTLFELERDKTKRPDISTFFSELPLKEQRRLLEYEWKQISSPTLLPTLRRLYQPRASEKIENKEDKNDRTKLRTLALQRLYELAPVEGRRLILAEMKRSEPRVELPALTLLPDETLPKLDQVFIGYLEKGWVSDTHGALVERYGSPNLYAQVSALLAEEVGQMVCTEQSQLLAYCLRINAAEGETLLRRALTARERTRCYSGVLSKVAELHFTPEVEKLALEMLEDSDTNVVISAVKVLGKYGSDKAEAPLWKKLEQWHQTWNGRERELKTAFNNEAIRNQSSLEQALQTALAEAPGWLATPKELNRLKQLCVTESAKNTVTQLLEQWGDKFTLRFTLYNDEWGRAEIGHYELKSLASLKQKLAQFPNGTVIRWQTANNNHLEEVKEDLFRTIQAFLAEREMRLVR
ncbi:MAG: hypothetical protein SF097_19985 [Acidobacteriota bacterium]|nr:hypothetical protein [Acidobacteriota bacterium]